MSHENPYEESYAEEAYADPDHGDAVYEDQETRQWAIMLHLSQFLGAIIPLAGFAAPLLIWLLKKDDLPGIDAHGRVVLNWIISEFIYAILAFFLIFVVVGIPMFIALGIVGVVFPIIGAIKASDGVVWKYPLSLSIL